MARITFEELSLTGGKSGRCPECGKAAKRSVKVCQTLNPFNKTADGRIKDAETIYAELDESLRVEMKKPTYHARCEPRGW